MKAFKILLFLFLSVLPALLHAEFQNKSIPDKVLVLVSYHTTHPWASALLKSMTDATKDLPLDYIIVELNAMRVPDPAAADLEIKHQLDNIRLGKYKMIVALNDTALLGLLKYAKELPPELPVVFAGSEMYSPELKKLHRNMTGVVQQYDTASTIRTALKLYPKTRQVAILYDSSPESVRFADNLKTTLPEIPGIKYLYVGDSGKADSLHHTLHKVAQLPEHSIVVVSPWRGLSSGDYQSVGGFAVDLSHAAALPYFVSADGLIGHGAVGGYVSVASDLGQQPADLIREVFDQGQAADIATVTGRSLPVFDHRVMTDHHLDFKQLPADSRLLNEPPSLWQKHSILVIGAGALLVLLLSFSGGLIIYITAVRRTMKRSRELYRALPGRIGVLNCKEKILYLNSRIVRAGDGQPVEYFREIPDVDYPKLSAAIADVFATGQPVTLEYEYHAVKRIMTIAPLARHLFEEDTVVWFSHDNTELQEARHQAEDYAGKLQKSTRMWNILINSLPIHIFAKDAGNEFRYLFNNKTRAEFYGATPEELNGKNDFDLFPAEAAEKLRNDDEANMENIDKSEESMMELADSTGKKHIMHAVQTPFIDEDGTRLLLGAMIDVTELEESRRVLEEEHALRDEMIQFIPFIFFAKDADHDFRYVMGNHAFEQFVGAEPGTLPGKTSEEVFVRREEAEKMPELDRQVMEKGDCIQFAEDLTAADGKVHHMLTYKKFFRGSNGRNLLLGASTDVTELQNAISEAENFNEELQDILSLYNTLLDNMRAFVFTKDIDNDFRFTSCNQYCCELMGRSKEEIIGRSDFELFHDPKEAAAFLAADREGAEKGETECVLEYTGKNGIRRIGKFFRKRIELSRNRNWLFLLVVDITEQEEMKRRAEENAEWLRRTLNSIGDGVITTDATGNIVMMNPVSERMIGVKEKAVIGLPHDQVFKIVGSYDGEPMQSPVLRTLRTGTIVELANHTDLVTRNGRRYHIADSAAPICDKESRVIGAILVFRDVTEEYDSRDKLRNALTSLEYASELTNSAAFVFDPGTGVMTGSKYLHNLWPIDANNIATPAAKWVHPDDQDKLNHIWDLLKTHDTEAAVFDYRAIKDGVLHYYRLKSAADYSTPGNLRFVGVIQDITEITASAMKLNDTIALWEQVINTIPIMFFVKDADNDFRYLLCNREFADFHGLTLKDIIG
ncbi:MAG: PAS domain-containing protein, partial [Victivallaceae bacterium]|nr:PAS domain-containing protein [Victivallaceae bacterium]